MQTRVDELGLAKIKLEEQLSHEQESREEMERSYKALEKRLARLVSEFEVESEVKKEKEVKLLQLEKELAVIKLDRKEASRKLGEQEEEKRAVRDSVVPCSVYRIGNLIVYYWFH